MNEIHPAVKGMFFWMMESYKALRESGEEGIKKWQDIITKSLHAGFEKQGAKCNSGPDAFLKFVVERDKALGLEAGGEIIDSNSFAYWIKDPFLPLKESMTLKDYENISTLGYVEAKKQFFVSEFNVKMTKNMWKGDEISEWIFEREE